MKLLNFIRKVGSRIAGALRSAGRFLAGAHEIITPVRRAAEFCRDVVKEISHVVPDLKPAAAALDKVAKATAAVDACIANLRVRFARELATGPVPQY